MELWKHCVDRLAGEMPPQQFNTWIRPLQTVEADSGLRLLAPNQFVMDWVQNHYLDQICSIMVELSGNPHHLTQIEIGSLDTGPANTQPAPASPVVEVKPRVQPPPDGLNPEFVFDRFVEGKSNQIAKAASLQVAEHPGTAYNPLFIYGGVGLGKTHLMHAVGNAIKQQRPDAAVAYLHSERFVSAMVNALQHGTIDAFKNQYRSVNALLIDDIQFFAGKERSQEEFFHTFNTLFDSQQQIILSSDRYPKEISGMEERLKSRFGWGLTVSIEPPDLETRVAILRSKAQQLGYDLPDEVAFFMGERIRSNIRELEGSLRRVVANAQFTGRAITTDFAREALRDMIAAQDKQVTIENIQRTACEYFKVRSSDLLSSKRNRSIARPRQIAMTLAKELTNHSLPEIGDAFGGRDHTTVLHAHRKIKELKETDSKVSEDYRNLLRILTT